MIKSIDIGILKVSLLKKKYSIFIRIAYEYLVAYLNMEVHTGWLVPRTASIKTYRENETVFL